MMRMLVLILVCDDLNWLKIWREGGVLREEKNAEGGQRRGNEKKMKIRVKLSFHVWVDQLIEPRHQINDVAVINKVKGRNFK